MTYLKRLTFDSELFGRRIGMIDSRLVSDVPSLDNLPYLDFDLVQAKVLSGDTQLLDKLGGSSFQVCQGEVDLQFDIQSQPAASRTSPSPCTNAEMSDIAALCDLASTAFRGRTRFRAPWFSEQEADKMYSTWIENAVRGAFDDTCLKIESDQGQIHGLVTLRQLDGSAARIGLLAVHESARKQGLGGKLVEAAKSWARERGCICLRTATQISSVDAMRLYVKHGAVPTQTAYWLYRSSARDSSQVT